MELNLRFFSERLPVRQKNVLHKHSTLLDYSARNLFIYACESTDSFDPKMSLRHSGTNNNTPQNNCNREEFADELVIGTSNDLHTDDENHLQHHHAPPSTTTSIDKTLAGIIGNVLEWYDFAVFGFLSDVIGSVFFPAHQSGHLAITESFLIFGGAFLMRPVGGVFLGYIRDKYGREKALRISIFLMAFPTFAMGCLPSYERAGAISIILLIIVRLLQGFSVGGQVRVQCSFQKSVM